MRGKVPMPGAIKKGTMGRFMKYLFSKYGKSIVVVIVGIVMSALASMAAQMFTQKLIDECIIPGIDNGFDSIKSKLFSLLLAMGIIYILGVIASFTYTRIMATVTQGTLKHLRDDMFNKMETLPIKYFDTHAHGDIMSTYTNDVDAVRQLIGQSLPTVFQSVLTVITMTFMMIFYSIWLSLVVLAFIIIMTKSINKF